MRINHNITSINAHRQLSANQTEAGKAIEKLSSGLRINRAGDDAAGLAISEKMRGQIRGLDMASKNSQDAISLIQTAEGALNETHSILQRMRELAVQSASDTNTADDRQKLQAEVDQLAQEITRISNTTEFNTQNLLAGGLRDTFHIGANEGQNIQLSINAMDAKSLGVAGDMVTSALSSTNTGTNVQSASAGLDGFQVVTSDIVAATVSSGVGRSNAVGGSGTVGFGPAGSGFTGSSDMTYKVQITSVDASGSVTGAKYSVDGGTTWTQATVTSGTVTLSNNLTLTIGQDTDNAAGDTFNFTATAEYKMVQLQDASGAAVGNAVKVYRNMSSVTIGDSSTDQVVRLNFDYASLASTAQTDTIKQYVTESKAAVTATDGTIISKASAEKGIDISTQASASKAITVIENALKTVSEERSKLGSYQNRLEHTINNLGTSSENLTAAESRIRDVDMAKEMMNFTKNNVLMQAAQGMLAQANQQPQGVLQLLR